MPGSAWADGIMAELAGQVGKIGELLIQSQPLSDHQPHPVVPVLIGFSDSKRLT